MHQLRCAGFRSPKQLRCDPRLARSGGVAAQRVEEVELRYPVIDLMSDSQRFYEPRLGVVEATREERGEARIDQRALERARLDSAGSAGRD